MSNFICPNKNLPQWKKLVKNVGLTEAYRTWIANGYTIPDSKEVKEFSRNKGYKVITRNNLNLIAEYRKQIKSNKSRIRETKDDSLTNALYTENLQLEDQIKKLKDQNTQIELIADVKDLVTVGKEQMEDIKKLLSAPKINLKQANRYITTLQTWAKIADLSDMRNHPLFSEKRLEEMMKDKLFLSNLKSVGGEAEMLLNKITKIGEELLEKKILDSAFDDNIKDELIKRFRQMMNSGVKDVNMLTAQMLDISEYDNVLFKTMSSWKRKADFDANVEFTELFEKINSMISILDDQKKNLFKQTQSNTDKRETGNFTYRFTQSYFGEIKLVRDRFNDLIKKAKNKKKEDKAKLTYEAYRKQMTDYGKVCHAVDISLLFGTGIKSQEYVKYLKNLLGEKGFQSISNDAKKKLDRFTKEAEYMQKHYEDTNPQFAKHNFKNWVKNNDPSNVANWINKGVKENENIEPSTYYTTMIPKNREHYDDKFKVIEADEKLLELHNYIFDTFQKLSSYLPPDKTDLNQINSLPEISRSILETFMKDGMLKGLDATLDKLRESTRTPDITSTVDNVELEITGRRRKNFQIPVKDSKEEINDYVELRKKEYFLSRSSWIKQAKTSDERFQRKTQVIAEISEKIPDWKANKMDEISKRKSWDLEKVMRAYGAMAVSYKHKAKIEDAMRMIDHLMTKVQEISTNPAGEINKKSDGDVQKSAGLKYMMQALDYYEDIFYGYPSRKPEGQTSHKVLTSEEKKVAEEYKSLINKLNESHDKGEITQDEWINELSYLYTKLDELGQYRTISAIGDDLLAYLQIKAMGWNIFSGFSNLGFGYISNLIEASDGRRFNMKEFWKASGLLLHSVGRSGSFGIFETEMSKKIHNIWEKFDVGNKAAYEVMDSNKGQMKSALDAVAPLNLQERTEFINQATVMVAHLLHKKVTVDGKEMSLWDAYDKEGNLPESLRDKEVNAVAVISEVIRDNHGNYDNLKNPIMFKKFFLGRAFIQFKTWAIMGFYNRFGGDNYSADSGLTKRGRYRSYANFYQERGVVKGTFDITLNLIKKLMFMNTDFKETMFDETDAANMRKNLTEIVLMMSLTGLGLLLKNFAFDDDDDEEKQADLKFVTMFMLNQMNRLQTDIMFYTNPMEFQKLNRQALPLFTLVTDASKLTMHMGSLIMGGEDVYETGIYAGQSKSWRYTKALILGLVTLNRIESVTKQQVWR